MLFSCRRLKSYNVDRSVRNEGQNGKRNWSSNDRLTAHSTKVVSIEKKSVAKCCWYYRLAITVATDANGCKRVQRFTIRDVEETLTLWVPEAGTNRQPRKWNDKSTNGITGRSAARFFKVPNDSATARREIYRESSVHKYTMVWSFMHTLFIRLDRGNECQFCFFDETPRRTSTRSCLGSCLSNVGIEDC